MVLKRVILIQVAMVNYSNQYRVDYCSRFTNKISITLTWKFIMFGFQMEPPSVFKFNAVDPTKTPDLYLLPRLFTSCLIYGWLFMRFILTSEVLNSNFIYHIFSLMCHAHLNIKLTLSLVFALHTHTLIYIWCYSSSESHARRIRFWPHTHI